MARQMDYLLAKTISSFNLFQSEIDKESNNINRINSKIKVLQLYSKSTSEDIYYLGDSFENFENVDLTAKYTAPISIVTEGHLSLPVISGSVWPIENISIKEKDENNNVLSNGTSGNYHMALKQSVNTEKEKENPEDYKYIFENTVVNNLGYIYFDTNPNTYFEYEKLKVSNLNGPEYDYEFSYSKTYNNTSSFVPWNNASDDPLKLTLDLERTATADLPANCINILPFFGYDNNGISSVKVSSIVLESLENNQLKKEEILSSPIVIGSTVVPFGVKNSSNYFYRKANIKFSHRNLIKASITFIQENPTPISVKHAYWTVSKVLGSFDFVNSKDYIEFNRSERGISPAGVWVSGARFNPSLIKSKSELSNISGLDSAVNNLVTSVLSPESVNSSSTSRSVKFSGDSNISYDYYVMKVLDKKNKKYVYIDYLKSLNEDEYAYEKKLVPSNKTIFDDWWPASYKIVGYDKPNHDGNEVPKKFFTGLNGNPDDPKWEALMLPYASNPSYVPSPGTTEVPEEIFDWWMIKFKLTGVLKMPTYIGTSKPAYYLGDLYNISNSDISYEKIERTTPVKVNYSVSLSKNYEILTHGKEYNSKTIEAKRWSIGIRDISIDSEVYQNSSEMISKAYNFPYPVEYLMLYSDYKIPMNQSSSSQEIEPISYYISIDDGSTWNPISPAENPFNSEIPEIYCFNKNISDNLRLPGVAYIDTASQVNSLRVKIVFKKPYNTNGTPIVNYYQLAAKVKRL